MCVNPDIPKATSWRDTHRCPQVHYRPQGHTHGPSPTSLQSVRVDHVLHGHAPCQPAPLAGTSSSAPWGGAVVETQPRHWGQEQETRAGLSEPGVALAVYSMCQPWGPSWARATLWGAWLTLAGLSGFFGVWVDLRVKAGEGQEVKCLQGPWGLGPSHPPALEAGKGLCTPGLCKRTFRGPPSWAWVRGTHRLADPADAPCWGGSSGARWAQWGLCPARVDCPLIVCLSGLRLWQYRGHRPAPSFPGAACPVGPHRRSRCSCGEKWPRSGRGTRPHSPTHSQCPSCSPHSRPGSVYTVPPWRPPRG